MIQHALVVGGLGFIGANLTDRLSGGGTRVTVLTPSRSRHAETAGDFEARGVQIMEGDIRDAETVRRVLPDQDVVFHVGGRSGAALSVRDPWTDLDVNVRGSLVLLESMREVNRDAKIVFVGSRLQYGRTGSTSVSEEHPLNPSCPHAAHKIAVEEYLRLYQRLFAMRHTVARVTNPYGPGQSRSRTEYGVVNRMIHLALTDDAVTVYGDGSQRRDYVYIDDVSAALVTLADARQSDGRVYNVGSGTGTRLVDMARRITEAAGGGRLELVPWPALDGQIETGDFVADISRIGRELGWRPVVPLDEGLQKTIAFYRAHVAS